MLKIRLLLEIIINNTYSYENNNFTLVENLRTDNSEILMGHYTYSFSWK